MMIKLLWLSSNNQDNHNCYNQGFTLLIKMLILTKNYLLSRLDYIKLKRL